MKVRELIEKLSNYPDDMELNTYRQDENGEYEMFAIDDVEMFENAPFVAVKLGEFVGGVMLTD